MESTLNYLCVWIVWFNYTLFISFCKIWVFKLHFLCIFHLVKIIKILQKDLSMSLLLICVCKWHSVSVSVSSGACIYFHLCGVAAYLCALMSVCVCLCLCPCVCVSSLAVTQRKHVATARSKKPTVRSGLSFIHFEILVQELQSCSNSSLQLHHHHSQ